MKRFMSLALATGLILTGVGSVFAASVHNTNTGVGAWINVAGTEGTVYYFDNEKGGTGSDQVATKAYPVLGSSGVYIYYTSDNPNFYVMGALSNRGDKCYGTSQSSTIIAMFDMGTTGHIICESGKQGITFGSMPKPEEITQWDGSWTKTDGSPLPATMTQGSQP